MKSKIKKIVIFVFYYSGLNWLVGKFLRRKVFCIGYHSIFDDKNKEEFLHDLYLNISINANDFEKQLLFLKNNGHTFIHFSDLKKPETRKLIKPTLIFFDDGFKDVAVNALPILKKYNIPATIFITTGLIDRTHFMWTLGLCYFLLNKGIDREKIEEKIKELKKLSMYEREGVLKILYIQDNFALYPLNFDIFLNWMEVNELSRENFEVGSHGVSHQKFTELNTELLEKKLIDSKKRIEEKISKKVNIVSYPYGRYNKSVENAVKKTGYSFGVSTRCGLNNFRDIDTSPFTLKKISPEPNEPSHVFAVRTYMPILF